MTESNPTNTDETTQAAGPEAEARTQADNPTAEAEQPNADESTPAPTEADAPAADEEASALAVAQARIAEYDDRYKRLFAEFENFRRRTAKERIEMITGANADLLRDLLPVVDDMDRAIKAQAAGQDATAFAEGIGLVNHKLKQTLERKGLKPFDAIGQPFDADRHEAITQIPAPTEALKNCVVDEIEKGYMLGEKVLRFAKVVVGV